MAKAIEVATCTLYYNEVKINYCQSSSLIAPRHTIHCRNPLVVSLGGRHANTWSERKRGREGERERDRERERGRERERERGREGERGRESLRGQHVVSLCSVMNKTPGHHCTKCSWV